MANITFNVSVVAPEQEVKDFAISKGWVEFVAEKQDFMPHPETIVPAQKMIPNPETYMQAVSNYFKGILIDQITNEKLVNVERDINDKRRLARLDILKSVDPMITIKHTKV